jgi:predicted kinase
VLARVQTLAEETLHRLGPLIEFRAERGMPRDCHGDLQLGHVYHFPERAPPEDLVVIDCIEFNERFRFIDPVADVAFPTMDLVFAGRRDLARRFAGAYFQAADDDEGRALLPLYVAYRAAVRGLVEGLKASEREVPEAERAAALCRARARWMVALGELEEPRRKAGLLVVMGLPGTGKSRLARGLAESAGFTVVRSDVVRKELAPGLTAPALYAPEWNERTYAECLRQAEALLFEGRRAVVDATFREEKKRQQFVEAAMRWGVPCGILLCQAAPQTVRARLAARHGDASDADWAVYALLSASWEEPRPTKDMAVQAISTEGSPELALAQALESLRQLGLMD